jgi:hypothetical protein
MLKIDARLAREKITIKAMVDIYCHNQHHTKAALCGDCSQAIIMLATESVNALIKRASHHVLTVRSIASVLI